MFFFLFVALQSFILSRSYMLFPYLKVTLGKGFTCVSVCVCVCTLEISYRCFLSTLDTGGGGQLPVKVGRG